MNLNLSIKTLPSGEKEITLDGIKYLRATHIPNRMSIFLFRNNHSTIKVEGKTVKTVLTNLKKLKLESPDADIGKIFLLVDTTEGVVEVEKYPFSNIDLKAVEDLVKKESVSRLLYTN